MPDPGDDDAAREHLVAGGLGDRVRLAGEQRLVDLEPVGVSYPTVGRDLVAGAQLEEIVDHDRFDRDLGRSPSRTTRALGALSTASRSSVRFARYSCTMPMSAFATSTMPNSASWIGPTIRITTSIVPRIALNRVKMLARTISASVRLVRSSATLTWPRATRSATSAAVSPSDPVVSPASAGVGSSGAVAVTPRTLTPHKTPTPHQLWGAGSRSGG